MTRDQQIGLAMGILLVGAVSAFFFRHEDVPARKLPTLKTAADLDRAIAERQHVPYLPEEEPEPATEPDTRSVFEETADAGLVPEPIAMEGDGTNAVLASSEMPVTSPPREQFHIVRSGDTLSSIAQQYLGSTARYQDVFDANRDRLRTPNDLRIGQEIRIPEHAVTREVPTVKPTLSPSPTSTEAAPTEAGHPGDNKFVPYRGSPLTPGKGAKSSVPPIAAPPPNSGKRLSQLPPKGDTVIR